MEKKRSSIDLSSLKGFFANIQSDAPNFTFLGNDNKNLYHYTDLGGLSGIVQTKDIWLTNSRYSNDDDEITYGYRIVREVIEEEQTNASADPDKLNFLQKLSELVREPTADGIYTCSFCSNDDLLSQWRGYGANGTGVSLAFDSTQFSDVLGKESPGKGLMRLWQVFYDKEQQKKIIKKAIDHFFFEEGPHQIEDQLSRASDAIQFFIPTFKHEGFKEEEECRMIFTPPPGFEFKPRFRVARGMLIPYYTLLDLVKPDPFPLPVTRVKIGPSMNKALNMESVRMLLDNNEFEFVEVESANIPYRG